MGRYKPKHPPRRPSAAQRAQTAATMAWVAESSHRRKLARAETHIRDVEALVSGWARDGYRISEETDNKGTTALFAEVLKPLPEVLPLVVGDALHCMRSSLDQLIFGLAMKNNPALTSKQQGETSFPISDTAIDPTKAPRGIAHINAAARADVISLAPDPKRQPIQQDLLWMLNKVENPDKHRDALITTAVAGVDSYRVNRSDGSDFFRAFRAEVKAGAGRAPVCEFRRSANVQAEIALTVQAVFDGSTEVGNRRVLSTLRDMHDHVRDVVFERLEQHFWPGTHGEPAG